MNKERRKALQEAIAQAEAAVTALGNAKDDLETCKDEEQDYFDNMPEAFQQGEKGNAAEAAIAELDEAISEIESAIDHINNATA